MRQQTHMRESWYTSERVMAHTYMIQDTDLCQGLWQQQHKTQKKHDGTGVAMYRDGVEGTDAFSLGKEPCIHRALLSVSN